jgi:hypothetical protein
MFFNKDIDLHFYTNLDYVHKFAPVKTGNDTKPTWFNRIRPRKVLDFTAMSKKTLKSCPGIQEYHKRAIQIPLWSDLALEIGPKGSDVYKWTYSDCTSGIRVHPPEIINNYRSAEDFQHLLFQVPWAGISTESIDFLVCQPLWHSFNFPTISITQGILNFKDQRTCNAQAFITRTNKTQSILIPHGTPLLELLPLTEKRVKVHNHFVDDLEFQKIMSINPYTKFTGGHYYNRAIAKKCPIKSDTSA